MEENTNHSPRSSKAPVAVGLSTVLLVAAGGVASNSGLMTAEMDALAEGDGARNKAVVELINGFQESVKDVVRAYGLQYVSEPGRFKARGLVNKRGFLCSLDSDGNPNYCAITNINNQTGYTISRTTDGGVIACSPEDDCAASQDSTIAGANWARGDRLSEAGVVEYANQVINNTISQITNDGDAECVDSLD
jgi:hypothetical protein